MKREAFLSILTVITICLISFTTESCKIKGNSSDLSQLTEKHWKLAELNGKPLSGVYASGQEPQLTLGMVDNTLSGSGGCNIIYGKYTTPGKSHITFSDLTTTKMFCDNMTEETDFLYALRSTRFYAITRDTLILKDENRTLLAKLNIVPVK